MNEIIVKYNGDIEKVAKEIGAEIEVLSENFAIITMDLADIGKLLSFSEVEYVERAKTLTPSLQESMRKSCIQPVHDKRGFDLMGEGVIVAVIDSGIDYIHPDFRNEDGTTRLLYVWDQAGEDSPPKGFRQGKEYTKEMLDEALKADNPHDIIAPLDFLGHGTAVAGIAAGNGRASDNGANMGVAPKASLIVVKLGQKGRESFARTTEIMRAIKYVIDKATELNMPLSINLSFGTNDGSHDGNSLFEHYIDEMAKKWKTVISVAAGNEGASGHHYSGVVSQNETIDIEFIISSVRSSVYIGFWKNFIDIFYAQLIAPNGKSTSIIRSTQPITSLRLDEVTVTIFYREPSHYNEDQEIYVLFEADNPAMLEGLWKLRITGVQVVDGRFDVWLPTTEEVSRATAFIRPHSDKTITIPATAQSVISVGGYNHILNSVADFSGRGYTRGNVYVKPDLVAPAVNIIAPKINGGYDSYTGTSMAAPFATGSAALMMEWGIVKKNDIYLYGQRVKAFLKLGAKRNTGIVYPNPESGYGMLCLGDTMDHLKEYAASASNPNILSKDVEIQEISTKPLNQINYGDMPIEEFVMLDDVVDFYTYYDVVFRDYIKDKPYVKVGTILAQEYVVAYTTEQYMPQVAKELNVGYLNIFPNICGLMDRMSLDQAGITSIHQQPYLNLRGHDVLIGLIDTGIDYTKDTFKYEDGTSKIKFIWDQTLKGNLPKHPDDLHYGAEFTQDDINEALKAENPFDIVPHKDTVGHGTFLAGIAAGREEGQYVGAAPDSEIIMVKLRKARPYYLNKYLVPKNQENAFQSSDILLGLKYILEKGLELNMPTAICIALGTNLDGHNGVSLFEEYISIVSQKTHAAICTPAGNESNAKHHVEGRIDKSGAIKSVEVRCGDNVDSFSMAFWFSGYDRVNLAIKSPLGQIIDQMTVKAGVLYDKKLVLENSRIQVEYFIGESNSATLKVLDPTPGIWTIILTGEIILDGSFHGWMPIKGFISEDVEFLEPSPNSTIVNPSTSIGSITCGAYNSLNNSLYISSSWGPTRLPRVSPDLVAPGVNVGGIFPTGYGTMTGTSVATAITTGAAALLLQWGIVDQNDRDMNTYRLRSYLVRGCKQDTGVTYPNNQWGYGKLNLQETFDILKRL